MKRTILYRILEFLGKLMIFALCIISLYFLIKYFFFIRPKALRIERLINQDITTLENLLRYFKYLEYTQSWEINDCRDEFYRTLLHLKNYELSGDIPNIKKNEIAGLTVDFNEAIQEKWKMKIEKVPLLSQIQI